MIEEGTTVVCVKDASDLPSEIIVDEDVDGVTKDAIYLCERIHPHHPLDILISGCCPFCEDAASPRAHVVGKNGCYCTCMFRPLNNGDTSLVEDEKTHLPGDPVLV